MRTRRLPTPREQAARIEDMRKTTELITAASNVLVLWDYENDNPADAPPHPVWMARMRALREAVNQWR